MVSITILLLACEEKDFMVQAPHWVISDAYEACRPPVIHWCVCGKAITVKPCYMGSGSSARRARIHNEPEKTAMAGRFFHAPPHLPLPCLPQLKVVSVICNSLQFSKD